MRRPLDIDRVRQPMGVMDELEALPGGDLARKGLADLAALLRRLVSFRRALEAEAARAARAAR